MPGLWFAVYFHLREINSVSSDGTEDRFSRTNNKGVFVDRAVPFVWWGWRSDKLVGRSLTLSSPFLWVATIVWRCLAPPLSASTIWGA
jgi:hypothetical protein